MSQRRSFKLPYIKPYQRPDQPTVKEGRLLMQEFAKKYSTQLRVSDAECETHIPEIFQVFTRSNDEIARTFTYCKICHKPLD